MPPPKYQRPVFSVTGRYLIDVATKKDNPVFHDLDNYSEYCGIESIQTGSMSRFDIKLWAIQRGFKPCEFCKGV